MAAAGNRFKKLHYDYDLISGKVNEVAYQAGAADAFYHKYTYDAENRLTDVETSTDHMVWEKDARYSYYKHGPLARVILGQDQVQGVDYAYTLQGWLKGVNSTAVGDGNLDMGGDGLSGGTNSNVARDVFGLSMNYYNGDYRAIGTPAPFTNLITPLGGNAGALYNGNITAMSVNIPVLGEAKVYSFKYDQLNRLLNQDVYEGLNNTNNVFTPVALDAYKEHLIYDANGNILSYLRHGQGTGTAAAMNDYSYSYSTTSNRLQSITNHVPATAVTKTYAYDDIGNTTDDGMQGVTNAVWNVYGKLQSLTNKNGENITYSYDASGQRISKTVGAQSEYYVKDATGNTMATYKKETGVNSGHLSAREYYKYGSSLLSIKNMKVDVQTASAVPPILVRGDDGYILSDARSNTLVVISDKKLQVQDPNNANNILYYKAEIKTANYYSSYGAIAKSFGALPVVAFNGQRKSTEIGDDAQTALYWEYNGDVGVRWNVDPKSDNLFSRYSSFGDNPVRNSDLFGDVFKVGSSANSQVTDLAKSQNQKYINIAEDGTVTVNFVGLSHKQVKRILNNDEGLNLINDLYTSNKSYYYGNDDYAKITIGGRANLAYYDDTKNLDGSLNTMMNYSNKGADRNNQHISPIGYDGAVYFQKMPLLLKQTPLAIYSHR